MQPNLEVPLNRKVCVCVCWKDNVGPSVRVMIRLEWSDMLSRGTISRAFRDGNMRQGRPVGSHQGGPWEELRRGHAFPFRWALTVDSLHQHLKEHNYLHSGRFYRCN